MVKRDQWIEGLKQKRKDKRRHRKKGPEGGADMAEVAVQEARGSQDGREVGDKDSTETLEEGLQGQALGVAERKASDPRCLSRETAEEMGDLENQSHTAKDVQPCGSSTGEEHKEGTLSIPEQSQ